MKQSTTLRLMMTGILLLLGTTVRAQTLYQTGFEAPAYTAGQPINGQNDWNGFNSPQAGIVSTAAPATGTQALQIQGSALDLFPDFGEYVGSYQPPVFLNNNATPNILIQSDVRLDGPTSDGDLSSANLYVYDNTETLAEMYLSSDGHIYSDNGLSYDNFTQPYTLGQYVNLAVDLNFTTLTDTFYVNGSDIGSLALPAPDPGDPFVYFNVDSLGSLDTSTYSHSNYTAPRISTT